MEEHIVVVGPVWLRKVKYQLRLITIFVWISNTNFGLNTSQLVTSELRLRNYIKHSEHCDLVEASGQEDYFSKEYGVNRRSILGELPFFDLTICLPHYVMHVILEGVLPRHIKLLLAHYIVTLKIFILSLSDLNSAIANIN